KATTLKIAGIHDSVIALYCFMTLETIQELINATDAVNTVYLTLGDLSRATAQKILYTQLPGVVTVEFIEPVLRDRQEAVNEQRDILWPGLFFSMVLAFAMVMNTVVINVAERTRETGAMLTLGTPKWVVARMILIENLVLSFSGLAFGMVLGQLTLEHVFINGALKESLPQLILPVVINPASWGLVLGLFLVAICLGQIAGIRRAIGLDLAVATKTLE
ncbi:MAG: ABC transporter permease, partial [Candidatus Hodarchaeales archaeon]